MKRANREEERQNDRSEQSSVERIEWMKRTIVTMEIDRRNEGNVRR